MTLSERASKIFRIVSDDSMNLFEYAYEGSVDTALKAIESELKAAVEETKSCVVCNNTGRHPTIQKITQIAGEVGEQFCNSCEKGRTLRASNEAYEKAAQVAEAQKHFDDAGMIRALKASQ